MGLKSRNRMTGMSLLQRIDRADQREAAEAKKRRKEQEEALKELAAMRLQAVLQKEMLNSGRLLHNR